LEYFSNSPAPCPSERLPKPKEIQQTEQHKRKIGNDDKGLFYISKLQVYLFSFYF
jgi:hypothetical protein